MNEKWDTVTLEMRLRGKRMRVVRARGGLASVAMLLLVVCYLAAVFALGYSAAVGERWAMGFGFAMASIGTGIDAAWWKVVASRYATAVLVLEAGHAREESRRREVADFIKSERGN